MESSNFSVFFKSGSSTQFEESFEEKDAFVCGYSFKSGWCTAASMLAEVGPSAPNSIDSFVGLFGLGVQDDARVRTACKAQDKVSFSNGQI